MHYLEETRPQRPLMPQDCYKRAKVREICEVIMFVKIYIFKPLIRFRSDQNEGYLQGFMDQKI